MICDIYNNILKRFLAGALALALALPQGYVSAQSVVLPSAGDKVGLSSSFQPAVLTAVTVDPENPLEFQFYIDPGQGPVLKDLQDEYLLLVKDFMSALTVPEEQLWVNLSPYEKDRIIDDRFGLTDMGRDLLAQDYILKQITASLIYPEEGIGRDFWSEIYRRAQEQFGTIDIPVDTFNKVWIMPDVADVGQKGTSAVVLKAHLKVMLESDYLAIENNVAGSDGVLQDPTPVQELTQQTMRQVIIPVLEKEVNEGKNFARLRQIYNALILAAWYKKTMRETFLGQVYVDQGKVNGIEQKDPADNLRIYDRYVEAFRKGVFNYVKEETDRYSGETIPRKYLSGGFTAKDFSEQIFKVYNGGDAFAYGRNLFYRVGVSLEEAFGRPPVDPVFEQYKGEIADIQDLAKKVDSYKDDGDDLIKKKNDKQLLEIKVKGFFRNLMLQEEKGEDFISAFYEIIDGKPSHLKSMILSGEHTLMVIKEFLGMVRFSKDKQEDIDFNEILGMLGFQDKDLNPKLAHIIKKVRLVEDYKELYEELESLMFLLGEEGNIISLENKNYKTVLSNLRLEKGVYPGSSAVEISEDEWVDHVMGEQQAAFSRGDLFLNKILRSISVKKAAKSAYVFLRSKSKPSLIKKLEEVPSDNVFDLVAGRFAFRDLHSLIRAVMSIHRYSETLMEFIRVHQQAKARLEKEKEHKKRDLGDIEKDLLRVNEALENYSNQKFVLVSLANPFNAKGGWPEWYKEAVHMVFMSGHGDETVEVQFKVMALSILHDLEHILKYKNEGETSPVYEDLVKYMWLVKMVVMIDYLVVSSEKESVNGVLDKFIKDKGFDKAEKVGGIDTRGIEGALNVTGSAGRFTLDGLRRAGEPGGFSPEIISVVPVQGLIFLEETPLPPAVFSRN